MAGRQIARVIFVFLTIASWFAQSAAAPDPHGPTALPVAQALQASRAQRQQPRAEPAREPEMVLIPVSARIEVVIDQHLATVRATYTFRNSASEPIAGDYRFPLPEEALAFKFAMQDVETHGAGPAPRLGPGALSQAASGPVVDRSDFLGGTVTTRGGWLILNLAIPPRSERRVEIDYSQVLDSNDDLVTFTYPLSYGAPRLKRRPDFDIAIDLRSTTPIKRVSSPTHRVDMKRDGDRRATGTVKATGDSPATFELTYSVASGGSAGLSDRSVAAGTVFDSEGAGVAGATITMRDRQQRIRTVTADERGAYTMAGLPPGIYTVEVSAPGFKTAEIANVEIGPGQTLVSGVTLEVGGVTEAIIVVAATPSVDTAAAHASASIEAKKLKDLPSLAPVDSFARLAPGASASSLENLWKQPSMMDKGPELRLWINTGQARSISYSLDGHDNNDVDGRPAILIDNFDSVDLLHVLTTRGAGDVSRSGGSALNVVARGGTNEFHGSAFDYYLNRRLGALSPLERRGGLDSPATFKDTIYGGVLGGPLRRDRLFFFGSFQGQTETSRRFADSTSGMLTPTPEALQRLTALFPESTTLGDLAARGPFASLLGPARLTRSFAVPVLGRPTEFAQVVRIVPQSAEAYEVGSRIDVNATSRDKLGFRYWYDSSGNRSAVGNLASGFAADSSARGQLGGLQWNRLLSPLSANDMTIGFNRARASVKADGPGPRVNVGAGGLSYGRSPLLPESHVSTLFSFSDTLSHIEGRHTLKLGGQLRHRVTGFTYLPGEAGYFSYPTFDDFVLDRPLAVVAASGDSGSRFTETHHHYFIDDAWRARDNLTLSFGLSYENTGQPINRLAERVRRRESADSTALFDPSLPLGLRTIPELRKDNDNFAPRLGFAYTPRFELFGRDVFGRDKTVIRGGASIFYDATAYRPLAEAAASSPAVLLTVAAPDTGVALPAFPALPRSSIGGDPRDFARTGLDPGFRGPYSVRWHLAVSRELMERASLEVGYVGARSAGIIRAVDGGFVAGEGPVRVYSTSGHATYHSVQSRFDLRYFDTLNGGISYTFSKLIDDVPDNGAMGPYVVGGPSSAGVGALQAFAQNPSDESRGERALSSLDRRHSASAHFVWSLPPRRGQRGAIGRLMGGWQTSGIVELRSGMPYTPLQRLGYYSPASPALFASVFSERFGSIRPFAGNPLASVDSVAFSNAANEHYRFFTNPDGSAFQSSTGFIIASKSGFRAGDLSEARFIYNDYSVELANPGLGPTFARGRPFGDVGRNTLVGPRLANIDFALMKTTKLTEKVSLQARAEFFNVFNHPSRGAPDFIVENAGGRGFADLGEVDAAPRRIRLGLKLIF